MTKIKIISAVIWLLSSLSSYADEFYNPVLQYTGPVTAEEETGCVYLESNGSWVVGSCDFQGAHNACYNGSNWKIAQAIGTVDDPGLPIDGDKATNTMSVDSWAPGRADGRCKDLFGPSYFFSAPTSNEENAALLSVLQNELSVQVRRTWLYYYSNQDNVPRDAGFWFNNRSAYASVLVDDDDDATTPPVKLFTADNKGDEEEDFANADCTVLDRNSGLWEDVNCDFEFAYACFESGDWLVTSEIGNWRNGYAKCDVIDDVQSLYAVPRNADENTELQQTLQAAYDDAVGADEKSKYEKVWLNYSDSVFEEFFVANQRRQAWWAESQPTNRRNADCTLMNNKGQWISESCDKYEAYHVCNDNGQWRLTKDIPDFQGKAIWSYGFGYCKYLGNATFSPPKDSTSYKALKDYVGTTDSLGVNTVLADGEFVWINYSDQANEGAWKEERQYQDFAPFDSIAREERDAKDCGFYSNQSNSEGNWLTDSCFPVDADTGVNRGFACTNGYEWKITPLKSKLWKLGFDECKSQFGQDYFYAAPSSADQNSRLGAALILSGLTDVWMNLNDADSEGTWVANGPVVNLSPVLDLPTVLVFDEKEDIVLTVKAFDPEDEGALTYEWEVERSSFDETGTILNEETPDLTLTAVTVIGGSELTINAIDLLNKPLYIDVKITVTDNATVPAKTTSTLRLKVLPPLKAAYDFNRYTRPSLDTTGNGHQLSLNLSEIEIKSHAGSNSNFYADLDSNESFSINGSDTGLQVGEDNQEYTLIYRFIMEEEPAVEWTGFMQKGAAGTRQPAMFYQKSTKKIQYTNSTDFNFNESRLAEEEVRIGQWMTVAYVKKQGTPQQVYLYVDKASFKANDPTDPVDLQNAKDSILELSGSSTGFASGDWIFGNVPDASAGIEGGFDDIKIYNRALNETELETIFSQSAQPIGRFEFSSDVILGDEHTTEGSGNNVSVSVERIEGDDIPVGASTVSVNFKLVPDTAEMGSNKDFQLISSADVTNLDVTAGTGTLSWGVHDRNAKNIVIELLGDAVREGTESFSIELTAIEGQPDVADNSTVRVDIVDKTPNPYGVISIATSNGPVVEGSVGNISVERVGTDTLGDYQITYEILQVSAELPEDFSITEPSFVLDGNDQTLTLGTGALTFEGNPSLTVPRLTQTKNISFTTVTGDGIEGTELFTVLITGILKKNETTGNYTDIINPAADAILGAGTSYVQAIQDYSPGRISFTESDSGSIAEDASISATSKEITLNRLDGDSGELCVNLVVTSGAGSDIDASDYEIDYLSASIGAGAGVTDVVYWGVDDNAPKTIRVTAKSDNKYEPDEVMLLGWEANYSCASIAPTAPIAGDKTSTQLKILDVTDNAVLKFVESTYEVSERAGTVTIKVENVGNRANAFKVELERQNGTAKAGTDFQNLTSDQAIMTFNAGQQFSELTFAVYDNCKGTDSLQFTTRLASSDALNPDNIVGSLPNDKITGVGNNADVLTANVKINDDYPSVFDINISASSDVAVNKAPFIGGRHRVTTSAFEASQMKLQSSYNADDNCSLQYSWSYDGTDPSLPGGGSLSADFSVAPVISGDQTDSNSFVLPFVIDNTDLKYKLVITHPEAGNRAFKGRIPLGSYWRRIQNNGENDCVYADGGDVIKQGAGCGSATNANFTYHPVTKQVVHQQGGIPKCLHAIGDRVRYRNCAAGAEQVWTFIDNEMRANNRTVVEPYWPIWWSDYEVLGLTTSPGGYVPGSKNWKWVGQP